MKLVTSLTLLFFITFSLHAQSDLWTEMQTSKLVLSQEEIDGLPEAYSLYDLKLESLKNTLLRAPKESETPVRFSPLTLSIPDGKGVFHTFHMVEYRMIEEALAQKYPHIKTYKGIDPSSGAKVYCNITTNSFYAAMNLGGELYYIDPIRQHEGNEWYVYNVKDKSPLETQRLDCGVHEIEDGQVLEVTEDNDDNYLTNDQVLRRGSPITLRTYRAAISVTSGVVAHHGGTVQSALDGLVTIVNRLNEVFEREVAIRLILIGDSDQLIFPDPATDPFEDIQIGNSGELLSRNRVVVNSRVGVTAYDIGHVISTKATAGQGLASLGSVCQLNTKANATSAHPFPSGDPFVIAIIAHEMGHQFNANHTMYHCHNVNIGTSYEPGSGTTIMSYTGICGSTSNVQSNTDPYYHGNSIQSIWTFTRNGGGQDCGQDIDMGNSRPEAIILDNEGLRIPINTAFRLTGDVTDMESDTGVLFCWEQYQVGHRVWEDATWNLMDPEGEEPLFRSRLPTTEKVRYFPSLPIIVAGSNYLWEQLPDYERRMVFRLTVRDNASENSAPDWQNITFHTVDQGMGQFEITSFNLRETIQAGKRIELTWNVAGTDLSPISTPYMDIYLSDDGGKTFPYLLKERTPNTGSAYVNIPNIESNSIRFMIVGHDNIFLDVNNRSSVIQRDTIEHVAISYEDQLYNLACGESRVEIPIMPYAILGEYTGPVQLEVVSDIPTDASIYFTNPNPSIGESTVLVVDFSNSLAVGVHDIAIAFTGDGLATDTNYVSVELPSVIFGETQLLTPADGADGVSTLPTLTWSEELEAENYAVQVATDPQFSNIVFELDNLKVPEASIPFSLEVGQIYFWRVLLNNGCSLINTGSINSFRVKDQSCEQYCSTEGRKQISATGTPSVSMTINTGAAVTPDEIRLFDVKGNHSNMGHLRFTLSEPSGTSVRIFGPQCQNVASNFNMGFDDDGASIINCINFNEGLIFPPNNPMNSAFQGITTNEYTLTIADVQNGQGGFFDGWCLEICGNISSSEQPILALADTVQVGPLGSRTLGTNHLNVTYSGTAPSPIDIKFTLVTKTRYGTLQLNGNVLEVGDQFSLADLQIGSVTYTNTVSNSDEDDFQFIVTDDKQGYIGTPTLHFIIGSTSVSNHWSVEDRLQVFPNPVDESINVHLVGDRKSIDQIRLYNSYGQLVLDKKNSSQQLVIDVANQPAGLYILQIKIAEYYTTRKILIQ